MSVSETFDRKFNKCMRGYIPEEVDDAIDALLRYCDDLESANLEFEVANNDLIDDKTALASEIENLRKQNADLEAKIKELNVNLSRIEEVYNDYRAKFGEARELVSGAKASAAAITSRAESDAASKVKEAEEKCGKIIADAEGKKQEILDDAKNIRASALSELDREIKDRKAKVSAELEASEARMAELGNTYSKYCDFLTAKLNEMLGCVSEISEKKFDAQLAHADKVTQGTVAASSCKGEVQSGEKAKIQISIDDIAVAAQNPKPQITAKPEIALGKAEGKKMPDVADIKAAEPKPEVKPEVKIENKPENKPDIKIESKTENKPEIKIESKTENKPDIKNESKTEIKPDIKIESKPENTISGKGTFIEAPSGKTLDSTNDLLASLKGMMSEKKVQESGKPVTGHSREPHMAELKNALDRIGEQVKAKKSTPNT